MSIFEKIEKTKKCIENILSSDRRLGYLYEDINNEIISKDTLFMIYDLISEYKKIHNTNINFKIVNNILEKIYINEIEIETSMEELYSYMSNINEIIREYETEKILKMI